MHHQPGSVIIPGAPPGFPTNDPVGTLVARVIMAPTQLDVNPITIAINQAHLTHPSDPPFHLTGMMPGEHGHWDISPHSSAGVGHMQPPRTLPDTPQQEIAPPQPRGASLYHHEPLHWQNHLPQPSMYGSVVPIPHLSHPHQW